jgi:hypothetical protein
MLRLKEKIRVLGGEIPEPWPWAVVKMTMRKGERKVIVDSGLYNLQLLELMEDLQKKATPEQLAAMKEVQ